MAVKANRNRRGGFSSVENTPPVSSCAEKNQNRNGKSAHRQNHVRASGKCDRAPPLESAFFAIICFIASQYNGQLLISQRVMP